MYLVEYRQGLERMLRENLYKFIVGSCLLMAVVVFCHSSWICSWSPRRSPPEAVWRQCDMHTLSKHTRTSNR